MNDDTEEAVTFAIVNDLDSLPFTTPTDPNLGAPEPRKCRRHQWAMLSAKDAALGWHLLAGEIAPGEFAYLGCATCGRPKDAARSRAGKNNRGRGLSIQRDTLRRMGLRHIPGSQLLDGDNDAFTAEVKSGLRFSQADWHELAKQTAVAGTRMRLLVKVETPGGGRKARGTVTVDLDEWIAWYGPARLDSEGSPL
jgi:hypothetical protein